VTGERPLTAFLDANVLYPAELRNLLMRLALAEAYRPLCLIACRGSGSMPLPATGPTCRVRRSNACVL
jgi:hypothetical protein